MKNDYIDNDDISDLTESIATEEILFELEHWTLDKIYQQTARALQELPLSTDEQRIFFEKLKHYRFVSSVDELIAGAHIRYISLKHPDTVHLSPKSAIYCKPNEKTTMDCNWMICKNYYSYRHFQLCFEEHLVFQKFTKDQIMLIESAELLETI